MTYIFSAADVQASAVICAHDGETVRTRVVQTGKDCQLLWARYEPGAIYGVHSHSHEQVSVMLSGRMRLTVGDEVRDIGPGDMWFAPANVKHGGEVIGDEPAVFIDVYAPPSKGIAQWIEKTRVSSDTRTTTSTGSKNA